MRGSSSPILFLVGSYRTICSPENQCWDSARDWPQANSSQRFLWISGIDMMTSYLSTRNQERVYLFSEKMVADEMDIEVDIEVVVRQEVNKPLANLVGVADGEKTWGSGFFIYPS